MGSGSTARREGSTGKASAGSTRQAHRQPCNHATMQFQRQATHVRHTDIQPRNHAATHARQTKRRWRPPGAQPLVRARTGRDDGPDVGDEVHEEGEDAEQVGQFDVEHDAQNEVH